MQNTRRRCPPTRSKELAQLCDALLLIKFVLIRFLNLRLGQAKSKKVDKFIVALGAPKVYGVEIGLQDSMHRGAILHRSSRSSRQSPIAIELELQSTAFVGVDRRCAETDVSAKMSRLFCVPRAGIALNH